MHNGACEDIAPKVQVKMKWLGILGGYEVALFLNLKMVFFTQIAGFQMLT